MGLSVAVTGATGEIGRSAVAALERWDDVDRIVAMARRPFEPAQHGWTRTEYRRGDVLDLDAVRGLVSDVDVVVHLAFLIMGNRREAERSNLAGARNVFSATASAGRPRRLVYTSSVAAYGFSSDHRLPLTEDSPARGSDRHDYSRQKAQVEQLLTAVTADSDLEVYVLRPCVVAGPDATVLADYLPWRRLGESPARAWQRAAQRLPLVRPVFPAPDFALQLVHHGDVAEAIAAATLGRGEPGVYNIAGDGEVSFAEVVRALGGRPVPVPRAVPRAAAEVVARLPGMPSDLDWIQVSLSPVPMDTTKAKRDLGWRPRYSAQETLAQLATAVRE